MKIVRFEAKVFSINSETKFVELADCPNIGEYPYVKAVEPMLIEAIKKDLRVNVLASEEKDGTHLTIIEASIVK